MFSEAVTASVHRVWRSLTSVIEHAILTWGSCDYVRNANRAVTSLLMQMESQNETIKRTPLMTHQHITSKSTHIDVRGYKQGTERSGYPDDRNCRILLTALVQHKLRTSHWPPPGEGHVNRWCSCHGLMFKTSALF